MRFHGTNPEGISLHHPHRVRLAGQIKRVADELGRLRAAGYARPEDVTAEEADAVLALGRELGSRLAKRRRKAKAKR